MQFDLDCSRLQLNLLTPDGAGGAFMKGVFI